MSKDCTSGTPAFIIVASCRVKIAMSIGLIFLPPPPKRGFGFFLTVLGLIPWRRSCALAIARLTDSISPLVARPCLSVPCQVKMFPFDALVAIVLPVCFRRLVRGDPVYFLEAGIPEHCLAQAGHAQVVEAFFLRLRGDFDGVAFLHDDTRQ